MIPQMETHWFYSQAFWLVVSFSLFICLMYFFFVPWILNSVLLRRRYIQDLETQIAKLNDEVSDYSKQVEKFENNMKSIFDDNINKLNHEMELYYQNKKDEINQKYDVMSKKNADDMEKWKSKFISSIKSHVKQISLEVVQKICQ